MPDQPPSPQGDSVHALQGVCISTRVAPRWYSVTPKSISKANDCPRSKDTSQKGDAVTQRCYFEGFRLTGERGYS